jgi:hypothetical protein
MAKVARFDSLYLSPASMDLTPYEEGLKISRLFAT